MASGELKGDVDDLVVLKVGRLLKQHMRELEGIEPSTLEILEEHRHGVAEGHVVDVCQPRET